MDERATISELSRLLGGSPVLLALPLGSKRPDKKIEDCIIRDGEEPTEANIAVLVGPRSGNIISIDCDTEEFAQKFRQANRHLCDSTLISKGNRGCNYWFRIKGKCPSLMKLKVDGEEVGEFRSSDGSKQHWTVIQGVHPNGPTYQILNRQPAKKVSLNDLKWIDAC
jgi:hypothetical protein